MARLIQKEIDWGCKQSVATPSGMSVDEMERYNTGCVALADDGLLLALTYIEANYPRRELTL